MLEFNYSISMQVLLTVNTFSTNRRRLTVKQTKTAGQILQLQRGTFVTLFLWFRNAAFEPKMSWRVTYMYMYIDLLRYNLLLTNVIYLLSVICFPWCMQYLEWDAIGHLLNSHWSYTRFWQISSCHSCCQLTITH